MGNKKKRGQKVGSFNFIHLSVISEVAPVACLTHLSAHSDTISEFHLSLQRPQLMNFSNNSVTLKLRQRKLPPMNSTELGRCKNSRTEGVFSKSLPTFVTSCAKRSLYKTINVNRLAIRGSGKWVNSNVIHVVLMVYLCY